MRPIGLDPGYGNVKVASGGAVHIVRAVVAYPRDIGLAGSGLRSARPTTVEVDGQAFLIGRRAAAAGAVFETADHSRFATRPALALMLGALAETLTGGGDAGGSVALSLGLPVDPLMGAGGSGPAGLVGSLRQGLLGRHTVTVGGRPVEFSVERLWVRAQPLGAWADWALDDRGRPLPEARTALIGIVDIGFNTVDLYGVKGDTVVRDMVAGADLGVRVLLEGCAGSLQLPLYELLERFEEGTLIVADDAVADWAAELAGLIRRQWRRVRPDVVLAVGGGAALLERRGMLARIRRAVHCDVAVPPAPVGAVARGLYKLAVAALARDAPLSPGTER